jgi:biopolymer transport protein ExbB/TolQ
MLDTLYTTIDRYTAGVRAKRLVEPGDPVLAWLIFAGLNLLTFLLLWFYGLLQKALDADPTHITLFITLIYFATSLHCLWRCTAVSRETAAQKYLFASLAESEHALHRIIKRNASNGVEDGGLVSAHVRDLMTKSMRLPKEQQLDQSLLLRVLAQRLNGSTPFGAFASDLVMKLGLFGTIVGFIMMLAPIAGLNGDDEAAIKSSMTLMSAGMAVAMYTTLAGLVGSILIRIEYQFVEWATSRLFASTVALTEVHVIPLLESART